MVCHAVQNNLTKLIGGNSGLRPSCMATPIGFYFGDKTMQTKKIPLTQGQVALVDDEDFERTNALKWDAHKRQGGPFYAYRNKNETCRHGKMHRFIMDAPDGMEIDHKDGNPLDNRKCNLRICSHAQNTRNQRHKKGSSIYKGVYWDKKNEKWMASITFNYKTIWLGRHADEIEAAKVYDEKAKELFGEFARLNFPKKRVVEEFERELIGIDVVTI